MLVGFENARWIWEKFSRLPCNWIALHQHQMLIHLQISFTALSTSRISEAPVARSTGFFARNLAEHFRPGNIARTDLVQST